MTELSQGVHKSKETEKEGMSLYQKCHLGITGITCVIAISSLFYLSSQVKNFAEQGKRQIEVTKVQSFQVLSQTWTQIDHVFIERPSMRPFFYEGAYPVPGTHEHKTALGIAELMLDLFELFVTADANSIISFPGSDPTQSVANERYMKEVFSTSPIMCKQLTDKGNWYSEKLFKFASESCRQHLLGKK